MSKYVLDASVIIKWYVNEVHSADALRIRDSFVQGIINLNVPDLAFYEVLSGLRYSHLFSTDELISISSSLIEYGITIHQWDTENGKLAIQYALASDTTIYDSIYLAVAEELECTFITSDQQFLSKIKQVKGLELPDMIHTRNFRVN
ncbi:MAG: type II toxin-antitoxin system VapC family toxin [Candidatus Kariarchaeaceae archaeon]|jgi:predicted nucleic acid-binding protein